MDFVVDLVEVISFPDVLRKVEEQTSGPEFERFLNACGDTAALADIALPKSAADLPQINDVSLISAGEAAANKKIAELQLVLDDLRLKATQPTDSDVRVQKMMDEIRRLETESSTYKSSHKVAARLECEKEARAKLDETRKRRRMINGEVATNLFWHF